MADLDGRLARLGAMVVALCAACVVVACSPGRAPAGGDAVPLDAERLDALYRAAIADAREAHPSEITTSLMPVAPYVDALLRRPATGDTIRHVLVATWSGDAPGGAGDTVTTESETWITLVPVLRQFCRNLDLRGDALDLRLAQRLGLPPDAGYDRMVQMWVRPADLFRPCADPEITDRQCERDAPIPRRLVQVDSAHAQWMADTRAFSYDTTRADGDPLGYPWTRLGYTYDWHPGTDEVGPSEYVVRPGATVEVDTILSTERYCSREP